MPSSFDLNVAAFHQLAFEATVKTIQETPTGDRLASLARRMERLADKQIAQAQEESSDPIALQRRLQPLLSSTGPRDGP